MKNINMHEMIADNETEYVNKAISFINNKDFSKNYGINLREKALSSPLFDTSTFTIDFCKLIKEVCKKSSL